jgi:hypothetical protein
MTGKKLGILRTRLTICLDKVKEKYMFVSSDPAVPKYIHLPYIFFPRVRQIQVLPEYVSRPNRKVVNAFIVPCGLIFLLNNTFILHLLYLRHILNY